MKVVVVAVVGLSLAMGCSASSGSKYDKADPNQSDCSSDAHSRYGSGVVIKLPDGTPLGKLVLRQSDKCQTTWGDLLVPSNRPRDYKSATITLTRPKDHTTTSFTTTDYASVIYGNMLRTHEDCAQATAFITGTNGRKGPTAKTPCLPTGFLG